MLISMLPFIRNWAKDILGRDHNLTHSCRGAVRSVHGIPIQRCPSSGEHNFGTESTWSPTRPSHTAGIGAFQRPLATLCIAVRAAFSLVRGGWQLCPVLID